MDLPDRLTRYRAIEAYRQRPLLVYATSTRPGVEGQMSADAVREFIDQIDSVPADRKGIDVLINSSGGDALVAWKLMSILRERFEHVAILVPYQAFSAATIFALGANEIVMHPHASLGPIDPQITVKNKDQTRQFAYEDVGAFLEFITNEADISDEANVAKIVESLLAPVDALVIGYAKRASDLASTVGERLLATHMENREKAREIARNLNKSFFAHGDAVSRSRARELNLQVAKPDQELERLLWAAYLAIESHMRLRHPFNFIHAFLSDPAAALSVSPIAPLPLPPNMPAPIAQHIWTQIGNAILQAHLPVAAQGTVAPQVRVRHVHQILESTRRAAEVVLDDTITGRREPNGNITASFVRTSEGWREVPLPLPPQINAPGPGAAAGGAPPVGPPGPTAPAPGARGRRTRPPRTP